MVFIKTGNFKDRLYQKVTVINDGVYNKVSVIEERADHVITLDKNAEDYRRKTGKC